MGDAMEEGTILRWLKNVGDSVAEEEPIAEINTEKADIEILSTEAGILTRILVQPGQTVPINTPIAVIGEEGDAAAKSAAQNGQTAAPQAAAEPDGTKVQPTAAATPVEAPQPAPTKPEAGGRVKATGLARKVAAEHNLDLSGVEGTGPGGRILEADVTAALSRVAPVIPRTPTAPVTAPTTPVAIPTPPAPPLAGTQKPLSKIRKVIARRLSQSKQTIQQFYI